MGRLDDASKLKVVELRKAGLSFRKIKAVLELENIKVSAQAIYLFLREFQGRPPGRVRPEETVNSLATLSTSQILAGPGGRQESWSSLKLQSMLRQASQYTGFASAAEHARQTVTTQEASGSPSGSAEASAGGIPQQQHKGNREEADIQIISVTSLAQRNQQTVTGTTAGSFTRRRTAPSPAINPILAARRRLLDKALSHRTKSFQQTPSLLRRDQSSSPGAAARSGLPKGPETYDLTNEATAMNSQPGGSSAPRRFPTQRPGVPGRPLQPPPRVDVRLQNQAPAPLTSSAPVNAVIRLQVPAGGQSSALRDRDSSPQDVPGRASSGVTDAGLQEQVKALGAELRGLAGALKMLVEQQCRLEREQAQQTSVQRQILSTLQSLAGQLGPSSRSAQQQLDKTPSPPSLPAASVPPAPASFSQDTLAYSQGAYAHCSQPGYKGVNGAATVDAFKLPGLGPAAVDGFPPCSNAENHLLSHASAQPYATAYSQPHSQPLLTSYSQAYLPAYTQSHSEPYRGTDSKTQNFPISCSAGALSDCSVSTQPTMNCTHASQDHQLNIIKVEGP